MCCFEFSHAKAQSGTIASFKGRYSTQPRCLQLLKRCVKSFPMNGRGCGVHAIAELQEIGEGSVAAVNRSTPGSLGVPLSRAAGHNAINIISLLKKKIRSCRKHGR